MEIGKLSQLRVLDVCNNCLNHLPFTINVLYNLQALWLSENQCQSLPKLQQTVESTTGLKVLTCYLLPQRNSGTSGIYLLIIILIIKHKKKQLFFFFLETNNQLSNRLFVGGPKVHFVDLDSSFTEHDDDFDCNEGSSKFGFGNFKRHDTPHPKPNVNSVSSSGERLITKKTSIDGRVIPRLDNVNYLLFIYFFK